MPPSARRSLSRSGSAEDDDEGAEGGPQGAKRIAMENIALAARASGAGLAIGGDKSPSPAVRSLPETDGFRQVRTRPTRASFSVCAGAHRLMSCSQRESSSSAERRSVGFRTFSRTSASVSSVWRVVRWLPHLLNGHTIRH